MNYIIKVIFENQPYYITGMAISRRGNSFYHYTDNIDYACYWIDKEECISDIDRLSNNQKSHSHTDLRTNSDKPLKELDYQIVQRDTIPDFNQRKAELNTKLRQLWVEKDEFSKICDEIRGIEQEAFRISEWERYSKQ